MNNLKFDKKSNNPLFAVKCLTEGLKLITRRELRKFLIIPVLANILLYIAAFFISTYYISSLIEQFIPTWLEWLSWLLWPIFFISFLIVGFFSFTLLANLIAAPFYGKLAAKSLSLVSGHSVEINEQAVHKVLLSELIRITYILLRVLPLLLLSIIPGVNVIAPLLWVIFGAWSLALEYFAYPLENAGLLFKEQRATLKTARIGSLALGGIVVLGLAIPVLNILIPPAAVIGATIFSYKAKANQT